MDKWFKDFENRPIVGKDQIPWPVTVEYEIQSKYFISNLSSLPELDTATDSELLFTAEHCNNLIAWIEQMRIMGYTGLPGVMEDLFEEEFGNRQILADLRSAYIEKWLGGKSGQHEIGENYFTIYRGKFYYGTVHQEWYAVESNSIFDIMPKLSQKADTQTSAVLNIDHELTKVQQIYMNWRDAEYSGKLSSVVSSSKIGETTPEDVLADTVKKLHAILEQPLALKEIERAIDEKPEYLEYLIKISCLVADFAKQRRASNEHSLYLLRDCAMFHEAQIYIDLLEGKQTSHDQVYLGRQSFSSQRRDAGHWYVAQELLLLSLQKHPNDFTAFYADFTQGMKDYEEYSPEFAGLVQELAQYLGNHIEEAKQNNRVINIIDLGFQGSINLLVKYVLEQYCAEEAKLSTKVHMYVVAEWFKEVYEAMYTSDTFSTLTHIEVMARNNAMYEYVLWSLGDGKLSVVYGSESDQEQADIELAVMAMTILASKQLEAS